jgi:hypothetical protein
MLNTMRSPDYLDFIRSRLCCLCLSEATEPHHAIRHLFGVGSGGIGLKGSDYLCMPICRVCHMKMHAGGLSMDRCKILEIIVVSLVCFIADRGSSNG